MADRLTSEATKALLDQAAKGLSNASIAQHAGAKHTNTITDWKRKGMPKLNARLLILSLREEAEREIQHQTDERNRLGRLIGSFKL